MKTDCKILEKAVANWPDPSATDKQWALEHVEGCSDCRTRHGDIVALLTRLDRCAEARRDITYDRPTPRLPEPQQAAQRWIPALAFATAVVCVFGVAIWWSGDTDKRTWRHGLTMSPSLPSGWERPTVSVSLHNVGRVLGSRPHSGQIKFPNRPIQHSAIDVGTDIAGMSFSLRNGDQQTNEQPERNKPS